MKNIAWVAYADTWMEFFKRCMDRKAETEEERVKILIELAQEGRMKSVTATNKTKEEYIRDKAKHFRVMRIKKDDNAK